MQAAMTGAVLNRADRRAQEAAVRHGDNLDVDQVRVRVLPGNRVDRKNAAAALNRSSKTLAEWKRLGIGPRSYLVGGRVFYDWSEVQAFAAGEVQ